MSGDRLSLKWEAPGPVAARFMASKKPVVIINGPIGSGKTTAAMMKMLKISCAQAPSSLDGIRKSKWCVVRDTYRQLWKTTLPSWFKRVPRSEGEFLGAENAPATHKLTMRLADGTIAQVQFDFLAIGENAVEDVLRGYEPTGFYLNETDLLAREVYLFAKGRAGRYPDMSEGGPSWYGIIADANAPELQSWLYQDIFRDVPDDVDLYRQPSGLSPHAENLKNLPPGYYTNQVKGQPDWYVRRMIENQPGYSRAGKPIYPEFNDQTHVAAQRLDPLPDVPLILGLDAGMSPAAAFLQRTPSGQWRCIDELTSDPGSSTGPKRFGDMLGRRLADRFGGWRSIVGYADPSAAWGNDKDAGEATWIEIVENAAQIRINAAPTNALIPRLEAVRRPLTMLIDGRPAFVLSPSCSVLREGFNSGYRFKKLAGKDERFGDEPDKNDYSHVHDALQYAMSGGGEDLEIRSRGDARRNALGHARHEHEWDPLPR